MEQNRIIDDDFREIFRIVNEHSAKASANSLQENIIQKHKQRRVKYTTRAEKAKKIRKQAILAIVASATILSIGIPYTINAVQDRITERNFNKIIAQAVRDNTYDTDVVLPNGAGYAWDYNTSDIAKDVLKNNKEIDTELEAVLEESEPINDTEILDKSINIKDTFSEEELKNFIEENEEIEDDLPNEYEEIVCENCGNTIRLDEIL